MDSRTLRNLMRIVQTGSLSAAAEHSCLTVQALAAQLNKVEEQFGFRLFRRSNKGLTLTSQGSELTPFMDQVLVATRQLEEKVAALKTPRQRTLRVALNTTLPAEFNRRMIDRLIAVFPQYQLEFSYAESMENLSKLRNEDFDLAILIGQQQGGLPASPCPMCRCGWSAPIVATQTIPLACSVTSFRCVRQKNVRIPTVSCAFSTPAWASTARASAWCIPAVRR